MLYAYLYKKVQKESVFEYFKFKQVVITFALLIHKMLHKVNAL